MIRSVPCKDVNATHMLGSTEINIHDNDMPDIEKVAIRERSSFQRQIADHDAMDSAIATKKKDSPTTTEIIKRKLESTNDREICECCLWTLEKCTISFDWLG